VDGLSLPLAAARLRVSRQTLWRWAHDPAFRAELDRLHATLARAAAPAPISAPQKLAPPPTPPPPFRRQSNNDILAQYGFPPVE
jgi:hypothetical protein